MTRQEAIKILKSKMDGSVDTSYEWAEAVRMAIEALEQEPCEDNRDKFLKEFIEYAKSEFDYDIQLHPKNMSATEVMEKMFGDIYYIIKNASSVVPSRATGKWKITINEDYRCDNCGLITSSYKANYCPNCGAYMRGDTE